MSRALLFGLHSWRHFAQIRQRLERLQFVARALIFVAPVVLFTVLVRRHLLRGKTFDTIKQ